MYQVMFLSSITAASFLGDRITIFNIWKYTVGPKKKRYELGRFTCIIYLFSYL